jgi:hypothetical protein
MIGVLASNKTLDGLENLMPFKFPKREDIANIFIDNPLALNMIHLACDDQGKLLSYLNMATELGGPNLHGFQLNIVFPCHETIRTYRQNNPDKIIILQISPHMMGGKDLNQIIHALYLYRGIIDGIIFDHSRGKGEELDSKYTISCLSRIRRAFPDLGLVVGGGLCDNTMHLVEPIVKEFPDISIDAEGKLGSDNGTSFLNRGMMFAYQQEALRLFGHTE